MKAKLLLKNLAEHIPYNIGRWTAFTPFRIRLGTDYSKFRKLVQHYENASSEEKYKYTIEQLNNIVKYAQINIPFYQKLYGKSLIEIKSLKDFEELPVITKLQIREYSKESSGSMQINTGGTSGEPLSFYIDSAAWAREWAHMHYIWGLRDYKQTDLIITMLGKNLGGRPFAYNAVHNEFRLNPYVNAKDFLPELAALFRRHPIRFFQGYPSSIYNFFREIEPVISARDKEDISRSIQCCFFSSEYPLPYMCDYLRDFWGLNYISWYGHSEMCILAYDKDSNCQYKLFPTYGYAEEVDSRLVGTSFHNHDMPLIRYSTGDRVAAKRDDYGLIDYFTITEGREGDFIQDRHGKNIPLTSFVFGRHHGIFDVVDYLQISQEEKGKVTFYITMKGGASEAIVVVEDYFDLSNVAVDCAFVRVTTPIRTKTGKLKLRLSPEDVRDQER